MIKGNIGVHGRCYYWDRDIHEDIAGGTHSFKFKSEPKKMNSQEIDEMLSVLGNAAWAEWGRKPDSKFSQSVLTSVANAYHDSEAMQLFQEGFDAM